MTDKEYRELLDLKTRELIWSDWISIESALRDDNDPGALRIAMVPFYALYFKSVSDFFKDKNDATDVQNTLTDIRNGLKIFTNRYNDLCRLSLKSDDQQDRVYRKDSVLFGHHYNIGVYISRDNRVVGDTQLMNYFLQLGTSTEDLSGCDALQLGKIIGSQIACELIRNFGLKKFNSRKLIKVNHVPPYGYIDMNTDTEEEFFASRLEKVEQLNLLHMTSFLGSIRYLYTLVFPTMNTWLFRVLYITAHETWTGIKKLRNHFQKDTYDELNLSKADELIQKGSELFPSSFRNCMMHYSFIGRDGAAIAKDQYDEEIPFNGLVETCFAGISFNEYCSSLFDYIDEMENYLNGFFNLRPNRVKWDL